MDDRICYKGEQHMSKHILIVDDDVVSRELARRILTRAGYVCLEAADGRDAITMAVQEQPDLILMDYHLPGVDGVEVTTHLHQTAATRHIPIVALSADIYVRGRFMHAGAVDYLAKPLRSRSLLSIIDMALHERVLV